MKTVLHKADTRGTADFGWLKANYSFSFANYYDPSRIHFGVLRVLNDDSIAGGKGFGMHPHDNMEIITIPLSGGVKHQDSMGNAGVVSAGEVQVMSAGSGITHAEFNASREEGLSLFQIWLFPHTQNVQPRYDQKSFDVTEREDKWQTLVSPQGGGSDLWIHQNAWLSMGKFSAGSIVEYAPKQKGNGAYLLLVSGSATINGEQLSIRDAVGVSDADTISISMTADSELLVIDVPMR